MSKLLLSTICTLLVSLSLFSQDLSEGLLVNDLTLRPMQAIAKPAYLDHIIDPSFGTTIRRITDAGPGNVIVPMYSTVQAWNADESLMILYNQSISEHQLFNGMTYAYIRDLDDVTPRDLEQIFWDFNDPDVFYYPESGTTDFIKYRVSTQSKQIIVNLKAVSGCSGSVSLGNDVQMMSWDSDVVSFRCNNATAYYYRISTGQLTEINVPAVDYVAPMPAPSGQLFHHRARVYNTSGNQVRSLNSSSGEHSSLGKMANGNDGYFAVTFAEGPNGGCHGNIVAHDLTTGNCTELISEALGYDYSKSGTHISALSHKNTDGGWMAASMVGFEKDGQALLDQELVIAKAEEGNVKICRIGHHRSDEDNWNYWGEPHAVISPTGTRVLFASDWSGAQDGQSIDCYVVELPSYTDTPAIVEICGNGIDDDNDGQIDEGCPTELCNNGIDDDNDGQIDEDCPVEICNNNIDDDNDGLIDEDCPIETELCDFNNGFDELTTVEGNMCVYGAIDVGDVIKLQPRNSPPSNPTAGTLYFDKTSLKLRVWNGSSWRDCSQ